MKAGLGPRKTTCGEMQFVDVRGPSGEGTGLDAEALEALAGAGSFRLVVRGVPAADGTPGPGCACGGMTRR